MYFSGGLWNNCNYLTFSLTVEVKIGTNVHYLLEQAILPTTRQIKNWKQKCEKDTRYEHRNSRGAWLADGFWPKQHTLAKPMCVKSRLYLHILRRFTWKPFNLSFYADRHAILTQNLPTIINMMSVCVSARAEWSKDKSTHTTTHGKINYSNK